MTNTKDNSMAEFEAWLRTVCFQAPPPHAYDLAKDAWKESRAQPERVVLSDAEIFEISGEFACDAVGKSNLIRICRAILAAQADPIRRNSTGLESPITQPLIAEAAHVTSMMAECMDMVRQDLIDAGIIDNTVPPMMVSDAVLAHIAAVKRDGAAEHAINQLHAAMRSVNAVAIERGDKYGACDQIDNTGAPYQSHWLADLLACMDATSIAAAKRDGAARDARDAIDWMPISAPGQVKVGTKLRFTIGDEKFSETAKQILHPGTGEEEIIYNKRHNYYLITSMAIQNRGSQKNVEFLAASTKEFQ